MLYEDGYQTRDLCFVEDVARANLLVATTDQLDGMAVNVGSGKAATIREVARLISDVLNIHIEPGSSIMEIFPTECVPGLSTTT